VRRGNLILPASHSRVGLYVVVRVAGFISRSEDKIMSKVVKMRAEFPLGGAQEEYYFHNSNDGVIKIFYYPEEGVAIASFTSGCLYLRAERHSGFRRLTPKQMRELAEEAFASETEEAWAGDNSWLYRLIPEE